MTARKFTLILLLWVLLLSGITLWGTFGFCGRLVFPLDDTYIFLQYARSAAVGYPFQYPDRRRAFNRCQQPALRHRADPICRDPAGKEALVWACFLLGVMILFGVGWFMWQGMARAVGEARARWMGITAVSLGPVDLAGA